MRSDLRTSYEEKIRRAHGIHFLSDKPADFLEIWASVKNLTMLSRERLYNYWSAVNFVCERGIPGDIVEVGVWAGGGIISSAKCIQNWENVSGKSDAYRDRLVLGYDTFKGHPRPDDDEVDIWSKSQVEVYEDTRKSGWASVSLETVTANLSAHLQSLDWTRLVEGPCEETLHDHLPKRAAVIHIDVDWYQPTLESLRCLWPTLSVGGVIILDDYGHHSGARRAVDEYFSQQALPPFFSHIDYSCISGVKVA